MSLSLKELTQQELQNPPKVSQPRTQLTQKVEVHPQAEGSMPYFPGDDLAPVKLNIMGNPEFLLWSAQNSDMTAEYNFCIKLLEDLGVKQPKSQLLEIAGKLAASIREQVQVFREVMGTKHCTQGLPGEQLVALQYQGQQLHYDLATRLNSPELLAQTIGVDNNMSKEDIVSMAVKIRMALKAHQGKLAKAFNEAILNLPDTEVPRGLVLGLDEMEIEHNLQDTIPSFPKID